ncbi:MAG: translation initiation factor IF-5A [Candidatus Altiarchaeales archaeon HGW-Altiarchaeales-3]|nr:MAG: translation initiation factor IF-5A [Candidatus Altiarchaeales archaeon HGW-Altiarchaeales-3]
MSTKIVELRTLKVGRYMLMDDEPCKITSMDVSKPGKHGEAKVRIEGMGIFDNRKRSAIKPSGHKVTIPMLDKRTGQVLTVIGDEVQLMDMDGYETFELPIPDELKGQLSEGKELLYMECMGRKRILQLKG